MTQQCSYNLATVKGPDAPSSELIEECFVEAVGLFRPKAELQILKQPHEVVAINQLDGRSTIPAGLFFSLYREGDCSDDYTFVSSALHRASEVTNLRRRHTSGVALALE